MSPTTSPRIHHCHHPININIFLSHNPHNTSHQIIFRTYAPHPPPTLLTSPFGQCSNCCTAMLQILLPLKFFIGKDIVSLLLHEVSIHSSTFLLQVNLNESTIPTKYNDKHVFILVPISSEKSDNTLPNDTATAKLSLSLIYESNVDFFRRQTVYLYHHFIRRHQALLPKRPTKDCCLQLQTSLLSTIHLTFPIPQMKNSVPHTMPSRRYPPFDPFSAPWVSPSLIPSPCIKTTMLQKQL